MALLRAVTTVPRVRQLVIVGLLGVLLTQGVLLNSDVAHEFALAAQLIRGNLHGDWHASHFPIFTSLFLLPAALAGLIAGSQAAQFVAALEFLGLGLLLWDQLRAWRRMLVRNESHSTTTAVLCVLVVATPLWVYVAKAPMDVVVTATAFTVAVCALEQERWSVAGVAFAAALLSRDQAIPVVLLTLGYLAVRLLRRGAFRQLVRLATPVVIAGVVALGVNAARYHGPLNFGPGYQSHISFVPSVLLQLLCSPRTGLVFFAPISVVAAISAAVFWFRRDERSLSVPIAFCLIGFTFCSAFVVHPNTNPSLLSQWYGWGAGVRFVLPAMPLALGLCPIPTTAFAKVVGGAAALVGCLWNAPMALVAYNAQERIAPLAGFHPPSVLRQYELIPQVARNSVRLLVHGHSPLHSSAFFFPDWQIEAVRVAGRAGEVGALLVSCALVGSLVRLRRARDASGASGA